MDSEAPLFILYTSGSTANRRAFCTRRLVIVVCEDDVEIRLRFADEDVYWCTADVGLGHGHSYVVYGPLANGATS